MASWHDGEVRDIHQDMMGLTLEIVAKALFNVAITEKERVTVALNTVLESSSGGRMLLPPVLRLLPTPGNRRYLRAARQLDEAVCRLVSERRSNGQMGDDLLSALLQAQDEAGSGMTDEQLRDEVKTILLAGHETTAVSLSWTWYLLAQHPEVERRLWLELREVLSGRRPETRVSSLSRQSRCHVFSGTPRGSHGISFARFCRSEIVLPEFCEAMSAYKTNVC